MLSLRISECSSHPGNGAEARWDRGEIIYHQGDPADCWYEVTRGMVMTVHVSVDGRRQVTGFFAPGEIFGAEHGRHKASAEAVSESAQVRRVRWSDDEVDRPVFERALVSAERSILLLGHRTAAERVAAFLRDLYARTGVGGVIPLPMNRSDIADYLGLTPETVSRALTALIKRGFIAHAGLHDFRIFDGAGLDAMAGSESHHEGATWREDVNATAKARAAF